MSNSFWWLQDFESKVSSKKVRRRAELYGYFYARKVFGLDSIMSDKDQSHLLNELQVARAEIDRMRDLLRWRDVNVEPLPKEGSFLIVEKNRHNPQGVLMEFHWVWPFNPPSKNTTHWMPMLKLPGGE